MRERQSQKTERDRYRGQDREKKQSGRERDRAREQEGDRETDGSDWFGLMCAL